MRILNALNRAISWVFIKLVRLYQLTLSYWLGRACRFEPTCSQYMINAIQIHGCVKGTYLGLHRIFRCHPWGGHGFDPVPPKKGASAQGEAKAASDSAFDAAFGAPRAMSVTSSKNGASHAALAQKGARPHSEAAQASQSEKRAR